MEAAVAVTAEHVKNRQQFGQPLGRLQAVQHMMAESFIELQETRSILYRGLAGIDAEPAGRRRLAVSAAKAYSGDSSRLVCANCVQLHGGYGITDEYQVGHCYRKVVLLEKMFGDTMYHAERVAAAVLPAM
jgi:alkylation response protein AidB-like acyl-CoA dehydrogenase